MDVTTTPSTDDNAPTYTTSDVSVAEGNAGVTQVTFTVSNPSGNAATVR